MSAENWMTVILLGMAAGAVGQLVRTIAGLAKLKRAQSEGAAEQFNVSTLVISLLVGATAGAIGALTMYDRLVNAAEIPIELILGLMAIGYTGADFIEGFAGKHFQGMSGTSPDSLLKRREVLTVETKNTIMDTATVAATVAAKESVTAAAKEAVKEYCKESAKEYAKEAVQEYAKEYAREAVREAARELAEAASAMEVQTPSMTRSGNGAGV